MVGANRVIAIAADMKLLLQSAKPLPQFTYTEEVPQTNSLRKEKRKNL